MHNPENMFLDVYPLHSGDVILMAGQKNYKSQLASDFICMTGIHVKVFWISNRENCSKTSRVLYVCFLTC